jgi:hypothetical protein
MPPLYSNYNDAVIKILWITIFSLDYGSMCRYFMVTSAYVCSIIQDVFKFDRQTSRACRWVQGTLRKISPSCLRRLIAEIQADEIP